MKCEENAQADQKAPFYSFFNHLISVDGRLKFNQQIGFQCENAACQEQNAS